ncbi:hypothetical protein BOTCAL_0024g00010 [Botryotinia calthae]|uniref:2EXR domain-containing protein n=1 Tax=Botryotinia calthae TaxID=38488 RepID=A0A4Y8DGL8_9HELO|nr:hypothetical protein BOTCAL_0024g00010 [Botryotinia calthae]
MAFDSTKIRRHAYRCAKITAYTIGAIFCSGAIATLYIGYLSAIAHSGIKSSIREARFRKLIKSSSPKKFRAFTKFNSLPKELQSAIWKLALMDIDPRTKVLQSGTQNFLGFILTARQKYKANIPALLHTSHGSREIAQEKFKLSFGELLQGRPVYFDIEGDTLWVVGGQKHCQIFPLALLGMGGFRNLIITPSRTNIRIDAPATSIEPLQEWIDQLVSRSRGVNIRIQIVIEKKDRLDHFPNNTNAERLFSAVQALGIQKDWTLGEDFGKYTVLLKTYTITN